MVYVLGFEKSIYDDEDALGQVRLWLPMLEFSLWNMNKILRSESLAKVPSYNRDMFLNVAKDLSKDDQDSSGLYEAMPPR